MNYSLGLFINFKTCYKIEILNVIIIFLCLSLSFCTKNKILKFILIILYVILIDH